jgi:hypothetical protein
MFFDRDHVSVEPAFARGAYRAKQPIPISSLDNDALARPKLQKITL